MNSTLGEICRTAFWSPLNGLAGDFECRVQSVRSEESCKKVSRLFPVVEDRMGVVAMRECVSNVQGGMATRLQATLLHVKSAAAPATIHHYWPVRPAPLRPARVSGSIAARHADNKTQTKRNVYAGFQYSIQ